MFSFSSTKKNNFCLWSEAKQFSVLNTRTNRQSLMTCGHTSISEAVLIPLATRAHGTHPLSELRVSSTRDGDAFVMLLSSLLTSFCWLIINWEIIHHQMINSSPNPGRKALGKNTDFRKKYRNQCREKYRVIVLKTAARDSGRALVWYDRQKVNTEQATRFATASQGPVHGVVPIDTVHQARPLDNWYL